MSAAWLLRHKGTYGRDTLGHLERRDKLGVWLLVEDVRLLTARYELGRVICLLNDRVARGALDWSRLDSTVFVRVSIELVDQHFVRVKLEVEPIRVFVQHLLSERLHVLPANCVLFDGSVLQGMLLLDVSFERLDVDESLLLAVVALIGMEVPVEMLG